MEELMKSLSKVRIPNANEHVFKDECVYSFDTPDTNTGLYVSLNSFLGFGEEYVHRYATKSGNYVFLHIRREKTLKAEAAAKAATSSGEDDKSGGPDRKITRLAIGVEGGYNENEANKYEYKYTYQIVVVPEGDSRLPYPDDKLPLLVAHAVEAILSQDSAISKMEKQVLSGTWNGEIRKVSKFAYNLVQLNNGKKIPPSGWKCEKCDLTTNLWLNLTDGSILCGRRFFDGSGGNDHALEHYRDKKYPLAVKLGTISADFKIDVFSYAEDEMVIDPKIAEHLAHFGINVFDMEKSEKTMVELELDINQRFGEWSLMTESDSVLQPLAGPGYTGMRNLGNSCYINSVMQVLFTIPDFIKRFVGEGAEKYFNEFPPDPANDFNVQLSKLGNGLWSGKYSSISENSFDAESTNGISPAMFKNVIGRNHPDFSTKQQQDACDFYLHFLNLLTRHSRNEPNPADALLFCIEERVECLASSKVKYSRRDEYCLPLEIPVDMATNVEEFAKYKAAKEAGCKNSDKDAVRLKVPAQACLDKVFSPELIEHFYSSATKSLTTAKKTTRLASMPDYLMLHLRKFTLGDDWSPKKLDVSIDMPDELDLSYYRAAGLQPFEELLPDADNAEAKTQPEFVFDPDVINELIQMGFPQEACKRAIYHTKNTGLEAASNWLMAHIADADISDPFEVPTTIGDGLDNASSASIYTPAPESLELLMSMGFTEVQATRALRATDGNVERATDWIFSHADEMDTAEESSTTDCAATSQSAPAGKTYRDGSGKYKLTAFISHMGTSAQVGHYVCHINKNDQWVIYNDSKVALSQNPPKDLGYMYLYKRVD